jgi:hypothetical protein
VHPNDDSGSLKPSYGAAAVSGLVSHDRLVRGSSVEAVSVLTQELGDDDEILEFPDLIPALRSTAEGVVRDQSSSECSVLFDAIDFIVFDRFFLLLCEVPSQFCELILNWMNLPHLPLSVRIWCTRPLTVPRRCCVSTSNRT